MAKITLKELSHSYLEKQNNNSDWALRDVNIDWKDGGAYALLGPSGCGKTTLLNIVSGLLRPTKGNVLFDDRQARLIYDDEQKLKETNPDVYDKYFRGDPSTRYIYQYDNYDPESMTVKEGSDLELLPENRVVYDISTGNFIKRQGKKVIIIDTTVVED